MAYVNLMDLVYPVGSVYFTNSSTSPATMIGGTWTQIQSALISASGYGDSTAGQYSGSNVMSVDQMPTHKHSGTHHMTITLSQNYQGGENFALNGTSVDMTVIDSDWTDLTGGGNPSIRTAIRRMFGYAPSSHSVWGGAC